MIDFKTVAGLLIAATLGVFSWTLQRTVAENDQKVAAVSARSDVAMDKTHALELAMRDTVTRSDLDAIKTDLAQIRTSLAVLVETNSTRRRSSSSQEKER